MPAKKQSKTQTNRNEHNFSYVPIDLIRTSKSIQPRRSFSSKKMEQLQASISEHGILEPLIVRPVDGEFFELVAGERRLRAARALDLKEVPVIVREFSDREASEVALLENLQRDDLNPIDETEGLLALLSQVLDFSSNEEVISLLNRASNARKKDVELKKEDQEKINIIDDLFLKVGRLNRESFRTNRLPLLNLPDDVLVVLREGKLEYTKAKAISKLKDEIQRERLMGEAIDNAWSLSEIKQAISRIKGSQQWIVVNSSLSDEWSKNSNLQELRDSSDNPLRVEMKNLLLSHAWDDKNKEEELAKLVSALRKALG